MKTVLLLLVLQGCLGAFDTIYYHELRLRLSSLIAGKKELKLHAARDFLYTVILGSLAWISWNGFLAWILGGFLLAEVLITLMDFREEDRSRKVPPGERTTHVVMAIVYGAFLATLLPEIWSWVNLPTGFQRHHYGLLSGVLSTFALGVFISGLRDFRAAVALPAKESRIASRELEDE
jgi:uncharacterized protein